MTTRGRRRRRPAPQPTSTVTEDGQAIPELSARFVKAARRRCRLRAPGENHRRRPADVGANGVVAALRASCSTSITSRLGRAPIGLAPSSRAGFAKTCPWRSRRRAQAARLPGVGISLTERSGEAGRDDDRRLPAATWRLSRDARRSSSNFIAGAPARIDLARPQIVTSCFMRSSPPRPRDQPTQDPGPLLRGVRGAGDAASRRRVSRRARQRWRRRQIVRRVSVYAISPLGGDAGSVDDRGRGSAATVREHASLSRRAEPVATCGRRPRTSHDLGRAARRCQRLLRADLCTHQADRRRTAGFHDVERARGADRRPAVRTRRATGLRRISRSDGRRAHRTRRYSARAPSWSLRAASVAIRPVVRSVAGEDSCVAGRLYVGAGAASSRRSCGASRHPARIALSVTTPDGGPGLQWRRACRPATCAMLSEFPSRVAFATSREAGCSCEMAIEDATNRVVDRDVRDLAVDGLDGAVDMGTAELLRVRTRAGTSGPAAAIPMPRRSLAHRSVAPIGWCVRSAGRSAAAAPTVSGQTWSAPWRRRCGG